MILNDLDEYDQKQKKREHRKNSTISKNTFKKVAESYLVAGRPNH